MVATGNGKVIDGPEMQLDVTEVAAAAGSQTAEETARKTAAEHSDMSVQNAAETDSDVDSATNFVQEGGSAESKSSDQSQLFLEEEEAAMTEVVYRAMRTATWRSTGSDG